MTTFVTCFFDLNKIEDNRKKYRNIDQYIENGIKLLSQPFNFIIFGEEEFLQKIKLLLPNDKNCTFVHTTIDDLPVCKILDKTKVVLPKKCNIEKDTYNYMVLMLSKTHLMEEAIRLNFYNSSHFAWIDFGFLYLCKSQGELDQIPTYLEKISNSTNVFNIIIPGCQQPKILGNCLDINNNLMDFPYWWFCGGFFHGDRENLLLFNKYLMETLEIMKSENIITWEVNVWIYIYNKYPKLFIWYPADHNISMLSNFPN